MTIEQILNPLDTAAVKDAIDHYCSGRDCRDCALKIGVGMYACDVARKADLPMKYFTVAFNVLRDAGYSIPFIELNNKSSDISISETEIENIFNE